MPSVAARLREERERLGLTQVDLSAKCGVTLRTQRNYETAERSPDANYLAALGDAGGDVGYVVTGRRGGFVAPPIKPEHRALIDNYENSPNDVQAAIRRLASSFSESGLDARRGTRSRRTKE